MNILIVEDDVIVADHIVDLARERGDHVMDITDNAETAISLAMNLRPDIVLADVDLGDGGDGIQAATQIREICNIRSIFITGFCDHDVRNRAQAAWPLGFITKPFTAVSFHNILMGVSRILDDRLSRSFLRPYVPFHPTVIQRSQSRSV